MPSIDLTAHLRGAAAFRFPHMELLARDHEPPIIVGEGELRIVSEREFTYEIRGAPPDLGHTLRAMNRLREDRYDGLNRFRLEMRDADGQGWSGGWTIPDFDTEADGWRFHGSCDSLGTEFDVSPQPGRSEARFLIPRDYAASLILGRFLPPADGDPGPRTRTVDVLGAPVTFAFDYDEDILTLSVPFQAPFLAPHAENWLGEPLRILFGQLVYPRLFGRHFPEGRSRLTLRPSPRWTLDSAWLALWIEDDRLTNADGFFDLYAGLLALVAEGGGFENHTVTEFYDQAVQAARGSRWVIAMTLASSIEGLLRLLVPRGTLRADADSYVLEDLHRHIETWTGPAGLQPEARRRLTTLKSAALSRITTLDELSVQRALFDLVSAGVGLRAQVQAWIRVRNKVMHGELVSPYSTAEDDQVLANLADLMRALTRELIRRAILRAPLAPASRPPRG